MNTEVLRDSWALGYDIKTKQYIAATCANLNCTCCEYHRAQTSNCASKTSFKRILTTSVGRMVRRSVPQAVLCCYNGRDIAFDPAKAALIVPIMYQIFGITQIYLDLMNLV